MDSCSRRNRDFIAKLFGAKRFGIAGPALLGVLCHMALGDVVSP